MSDWDDSDEDINDFSGKARKGSAYDEEGSTYIIDDAVIESINDYVKRITGGEDRSDDSTGVARKESGVGGTRRESRAGEARRVNSSSYDRVLGSNDDVVRKASSSGGARRASNSAETRKGGDIVATRKTSNSGETKKSVSKGETRKASKSVETRKTSNREVPNKASKTGETKKLTNNGDTRGKSKYVETRKTSNSKETRVESNGGESKQSNSGESNQGSNSGGSKEASNSGGSKETSNSGGSKQASNSGGSKQASNSSGSKEASNSGGSKEARNSEERRKMINAGESRKASYSRQPLENKDRGTTASLAGVARDQIDVNFSDIDDQDDTLPKSEDDSPRSQASTPYADAELESKPKQKESPTGKRTRSSDPDIGKTITKSDRSVVGSDSTTVRKPKKSNASTGKRSASSQGKPAKSSLLTKKLKRSESLFDKQLIAQQMLQSKKDIDTQDPTASVSETSPSTSAVGERETPRRRKISSDKKTHERDQNTPDDSRTEYHTLVSKAYDSRGKTDHPRRGKDFRGSSRSKSTPFPETSRARDGGHKQKFRQGVKGDRGPESLRRKFYETTRLYPQMYKRFLQAQTNKQMRRTKRRHAEEKKRARKLKDSIRSESIFKRCSKFLIPMKEKYSSYLSKIVSVFYYLALLAGISLVSSSVTMCLKLAFMHYLNYYKLDVT